MSHCPRVFTIPPSAPFLRTLAGAILDGTLIPGFAPREAPERLADATIYLPTRRAARALASVLLEETGSPALVLPRVVPLGDVDEEALAFEPGMLEPVAPSIAAGERRLALAQLIAGFAKKEAPLVTASPAIAIALADELAHLMDDFITAGMKFADAQRAVEDKFADYDDYWKRSRDFLAIVDWGWSSFLKERGNIDAASRRDTLLEREAERLARSSSPVIAAGSTGTLPKVAELLRVIASRKNGAVVLPGLDQSLDADSFASIGSGEDPLPGHPQFGLKRLIEKIAVAREDIVQLGEAAYPLREDILSLAFRPQGGADDKHRLARAGSLEGVTIVEAQDAREEALSIAIALREALHDKKTAALVTPDRALARRVRAELTRWGIDIDDSAGLPLADSEAGRLARLVAMAADDKAAPSTILALLHHPYLRDQFASEDIALFELACMRGARPAGGVAGLPAAIAALRRDEFHRSDRREQFGESGWDRAAEVARKLSEMLAPLTALSQGDQEFLELAKAHSASLTATLVSDDNGDDRAEIRAAMEALVEAGRDAPMMTLADYAESFPATLREYTLRPVRAENERLRILGPLEARMISADRIVLGGLCEGVWPPQTNTDSWLNRPMRRAMGLDLPERRIGLSAHDFVQTASAHELLLVRARKQGGVETIASRFLQRVAAVADEQDLQSAMSRGEKYLGWARSLENAPLAEPSKPPEPRPPLAVRPRRFSMSDMRDLTRDPYSIYARKILNLRKLDAIDEEPGRAERGTLLHHILSQFSARHPGELPASALDDLIDIGREAFKSMQSFPAALAIWWPRFKRAARWFVEEERKRRGSIRTVHPEVYGKIEFGSGSERFTLTARADRIEVNKDGSLAVLDFKTGTVPTYKEAILGFEPQLLLEAAIAQTGGFSGIEGGNLAAVGPIKISGGQPPGEFKLFELSTREDFKAVSEPRGISGDDHLDKAAQSARTGAEKLLASYMDMETPYPFAPRVQWQKDYNDYEHLARFKEWSEGE